MCTKNSGIQVSRTLLHLNVKMVRVQYSTGIAK